MEFVLGAKCRTISGTPMGFLQKGYSGKWILDLAGFKIISFTWFYALFIKDYKLAK
jgi:hypothetical protein